ncbi:hypothetical protein OUZ56_029031 [Daphnia magna]|uniref:Uncharacterized protein n=1 Tax=Daphnia magna TaxID=35525 RepID=A0ABR0B5P6_9CRUS|nr:hypothetical protein OUZ56_029031 [Daphnia magna]
MGRIVCNQGRDVYIVVHGERQQLSRILAVFCAFRPTSSDRAAVMPPGIFCFMQTGGKEMGGSFKVPPPDLHNVKGKHSKQKGWVDEGNGTVYISVGTAKDDTTNTTSCNATSKPGRSTTDSSTWPMATTCVPLASNRRWPPLSVKSAAQALMDEALG